MDDPSVGGGVILCARRTRRASALGVGLFFAFWATTLLADDPGTVWPRPAAFNPGPIEPAPGIATYPESTRFDGATSLAPAGPGLPFARSGESLSLPPTDAPLFHLASLQDPDAPPDPMDPAPDSGESSNGASNRASGQEPQKYGKEPVDSTLQFLRNTGLLLDPGSYQFDIGFNYTLFDTQFPVPTKDAVGNVTDVVQGTIRQRLFYSPFAVRYGWTKNIQLFGVLPAGYTDTQTSTFGSSITDHRASLGDLTAGANVHLLKAEQDYPDVIATLACTAPTGNYTAPINVVVPGSALGQGFWALSGQLTMIHRYDPVIVFYGGGYRHLFERSFGGTPFAAGEQVNYLLGTGFAINDRVTVSGALLGLYVCNTRVDHDTVRGSNLEPLSLRFATTISRRCHIIEPFFSIGMTPSAPAASVGLTLTYY